MIVLEIRVAKAEEFGAVRAFYHSLIDDMQNSPYLPGWEKDIYPSNEYLREANFISVKSKMRSPRRWS